MCLMQMPLGLSVEETFKVLQRTVCEVNGVRVPVLLNGLAV